MLFELPYRVKSTNEKASLRHNELNSYTFRLKYSIQFHVCQAI